MPSDEIMLASNSIKIDSRWLKYVAPSRTSLCWYCKSPLFLLQMLSTNTLDSPWLFRNKTLNFSQVVRPRCYVQFRSCAIASKRKFYFSGKKLKKIRIYGLWLWLSQNDLHIANKSNSTPYASYHNKTPDSQL